MVQTIQATYDTAPVKKWEKPPWMVSTVYESAYLEDIKREQKTEKRKPHTNSIGVTIPQLLTQIFLPSL